MNVPDRILEDINHYFPEKEPSEIWEVLSQYGTENHEKGAERVYRAILELSKGNFDDLIYYTKAAKADYRDVLFWNDGSGKM